MNMLQNKLSIRKLYHSTVVLIFVLFVTSSCNKEDEPFSNVNRDRIRVKEIIRVDKAEVPDDTTMFFYNSDYQLSEVSVRRINHPDYLSIRFDYTQSTITSSSYGACDTNLIKLNSNGTLSQFSLWGNSFELTYNQDGQLAKVSGHDRETSPRKFEFSYENGNLVKIIDDLGDGYWYSTKIEYTDIPNKTNYTLLEQDQLFVGPYFLGLIWNINKNLVKRVIFELDTLNYDYVLNKDDLPVKILVNGVPSSLVNYY